MWFNASAFATNPVILEFHKRANAPGIIRQLISVGHRTDQPPGRADGVGVVSVAKEPIGTGFSGSGILRTGSVFNTQVRLMASTIPSDFAKDTEVAFVLLWLTS
jgi:hypothetical protein